MELVYTVVTLNGRGFMFEADDMCEVLDEYVFSLDGETVAQFKKEAIAGYFITRVEDDEEAED
jgi:hypothetical protein